MKKENKKTKIKLMYDRYSHYLYSMLLIVLFVLVMLNTFGVLTDKVTFILMFIPILTLVVIFNISFFRELKFNSDMFYDKAPFLTIMLALLLVNYFFGFATGNMFTLSGVRVISLDYSSTSIAGKILFNIGHINVIIMITSKLYILYKKK